MCNLLIVSIVANCFVISRSRVRAPVPATSGNLLSENNLARIFAGDFCGCEISSSRKNPEQLYLGRGFSRRPGHADAGRSSALFSPAISAGTAAPLLGAVASPFLKRSGGLAVFQEGGGGVVSDPIHILSLGAGVQSSTLALLAAAGEVTPMPTAAIFADTQAEPASVYRWLDWLEKQLPFPVIRARRANVDSAGQVIQRNHSQIPAWKDGAPGKRQCTKDWKIVPVQRACRELTGTKGKRLPNGFITLWIGISRDEVTRMKDSREPWITHRWPLVERNLRRSSCLEWMAARGFAKPPRSACEFCPYKGR